ncbi:MAG: TonB-dependent receptor plug domain-containing protein [Novosphingobium sp.]|nr:TonB-dependent receptor plug domain-containing protein [Novosphingobium sp.]
MKLQHILMATTILAVPGTALAQEAVDDNVILVTAQNRAQNVQDVPIAIEVVTGEALETSGVTDFTALQRVAPVLNVVSDTVHTRVTVRGIGSNSNDEAQDQAIAVNIDGEYLNRTVVLNASMFDIERVEVLRGPQGTLYGRNATGGAVNVITRKPGDDFGMNGSVSYGNYDALVLQGGMDIPIGDVGGIRAAGIWTRRDGYNTHPNTNTTSDDDNTRAGRLSLRLRPAFFSFFSGGDTFKLNF